jgi:hypothetical protein
MHELPRGSNAGQGYEGIKARNHGQFIMKGTMNEEIENDTPGGGRSIGNPP